VLFLVCPAGISLLSENVLRAADVALVPTPLSMRMLTQLQQFIIQEGWTDLALLPFFSMVALRHCLHGELIESTRAQLPPLLATEVPYRSEIERTSLERAPLPARSPRSQTGLIYAALWAEIVPSLGEPTTAVRASPRPAPAGSHDVTLRNTDYVLRE
jgi:chromosome partitioning protein